MKLEVKLKQHTPLIHFQHDQEGATLRASEVKPKLDKYVLSNLKRSERTQGKNEGWIKEKNGKVWLDYKMRIKSSEPRDLSMEKQDQLETDRRTKVKVRKHDEIGRPLFTTPNYPNNYNSLIMGNMGGRIEEELLNFVMYDNVSLTLIFDNETLCEKVKENLSYFFFETCFGNRTTKGFGSFMAYSINGEVCKISPYYNWQISFDLTSDTEDISERNAMQDIFTVINKVWKGLKNYSRAPRGELRSVFLNVPSHLTNREDRIPSPVSFKPRIKSRSEEKWEVVIYVFLNPDVISAAGADEDNLSNKIEQAVQGTAISNTLRRRDLRDFFYNISNINIR